MRFSRNALFSIVGSMLLSGALSKPIPVPHANDLDSAVESVEPKPYVIMLADSETRPVLEVAASMGYNQSDILKVWEGLRGFSVKTHKSNAVQMLSTSENIDCMEADMEMKLSVMPYDKTQFSRLKRRDAEIDDASITRPGFSKRQVQNLFLQQQASPWNLERLSCKSTIQEQGRNPTDIAFQYRFEQSAGEGVDVYVLDTGVNTAHEDFGGRAQSIFSVDNDARDGEGHGSHTAGTIGSKTFGVAKKANIFSVKVFTTEGAGSLSGTLDGIAEATKRHNQRKNQPDFRGSVINMSLGAPGESRSMGRALKAATDAGIHVVVAAGNENEDACNSTPSGLSTELPILTVGATTIEDTRASFSNFGQCVQVYAPGTQITSTFNQGPDSVRVLQGTSMACPLVAGQVAYYCNLFPELANNPAAMREKIIADSQVGVIQDRNPRTGEKVLVNNGYLNDPEAAAGQGQGRRQ